MSEYYPESQKVKKNLFMRAFDICCARILLGFYPAENRVTTHLTFQEKQRLMSLARKCSGTSVYVEIGSYIGASACFIAAGMNKYSGSKLHCIDTWRNEGMAEGKRDTFAEFKKNTAKYKDLIIPHRGESQDLAGRFNARVDFLFIDGDHSYEGVRADVDSWFPKLKPGALVLFHDVGWAKGVQQVVAETVKPRAKSEDCLPNLYWAWL
jgi:predicted O-methyltransferase YrrM